MTVKNIFTWTKALLETNSSLKNRVSIWDYSILDVAAPYAVVLRPGRVTQAVEAYGNQWLRTVMIVVEAHAFYEPANSTASVNRLIDLIDIIDTLLIENYHLGRAVTEVQMAGISGISDMDTVARGTGGNKWFHVTITIAAQEPEVGSGAAQ